MKDLVVTLPTNDAYERNGINLHDTKELVRAFSYVKNDKEIITVRWYMGISSKSSVVYCSIWINASDIYFSGTGKAGGYGFSTSFENACESAGISISPSIHGVGEGAIKEVLLKIGEILGCPNGLIIQH